MDSFEAYLNATNEKQLIADFFANNFFRLDIAKRSGHQRILDMGCGSGEVSLKFLQTLKENGIDYSYDALDISGSSLRKFQLKSEVAGLSDINFIEKPFQEFKHTADSYEFLIACQSLYYFTDLPEVVNILLSMAKESMIVHHGLTGLEAFEDKFKDYLKKSKFGVSTYIDIQNILKEREIADRYEITFQNITCDVNIAKCKNSASLEGRALISFFLGNDIEKLPGEVQKAMIEFLSINYPDIIKRQQGIFFCKKRG